MYAKASLRARGAAGCREHVGAAHACAGHSRRTLPGGGLRVLQQGRNKVEEGQSGGIQRENRRNRGGRWDKIENISALGGVAAGGSHGRAGGGLQPHWHYRGGQVLGDVGQHLRVQLRVV